MLFPCFLYLFVLSLSLLLPLSFSLSLSSLSFSIFLTTPCQLAPFHAFHLKHLSQTCSHVSSFILQSTSSPFLLCQYKLSFILFSILNLISLLHLPSVRPFFSYSAIPVLTISLYHLLNFDSSILRQFPILWYCFSRFVFFHLFIFYSLLLAFLPYPIYKEFFPFLLSPIHTSYFKYILKLNKYIRAR